MLLVGVQQLGKVHSDRAALLVNEEMVARELPVAEIVTGSGGPYTHPGGGDKEIVSATVCNDRTVDHSAVVDVTAADREISAHRRNHERAQLRLG